MLFNSLPSTGSDLLPHGVIASRLVSAVFSWRADRETGLEHWRQLLESLTALQGQPHNDRAMANLIVRGKLGTSRAQPASSWPMATTSNGFPLIGNFEKHHSTVPVMRTGAACENLNA